VVVHGGGPQLNDELAKAGVEPQYIGGHRVTDPETLKIAVRVFESANLELSKSLEKGGLNPFRILGGVFNAKVTKPELGKVGEIFSVNSHAIEQALLEGKTPVLTSLGVDLEDGKSPLNINADVAARELSIALKPSRVVFISASGGWKDNGAIVSQVNMAADYAKYRDRDYTGRQGTLLKLNEMKAIVDALPPSSSLTIASASALASQLLPHRGPGSQIRKGIVINAFSRPEGTDSAKLVSLLSSFGGKIDSMVADFISKNQYESTGLFKSFAGLLVTEDYSAAAIVVNIADCPVPVLASLVMTPLAYAEGTEFALWNALSETFPSLVWLASSGVGIADAVKTIKAKGASAIPTCFPMLSATRSLVYSSGSQTLNTTTLAWKNVPLDHVPKVASSLKSFCEVVDESPSKVTSKVPSQPNPVSVTPTKSKIHRIGLIGARGYTGREFVRLLANHPSMVLVAASSRALVGQDVLRALELPADVSSGILPGLVMSDISPESISSGNPLPDVDAWVLAMPNGVAQGYDDAFSQRYKNSEKKPILIDLSADMRFKNPVETGWVYGLPERPHAKEAIMKAKKIANPGCYATGSQIGLFPLLSENKNSPIMWDPSFVPHVFGVSGYSGAGTTPSDKNNPSKLAYNILPYSLVGHIHEREISSQCHTQVAFMPHVAPYFQGISLTISGKILVKSSNEQVTVTPAFIEKIFKEYYSNAPLIRVLSGGPKVTPDVRTHGALSHGATVGGFSYDESTKRLALVVCIDNLLKGAATQAVQNLNLALGCDEYAGIPMSK
jgi:N-acetyl-gamma-glutamyl-phosphate reductase / acetylglutamate kinase